MQHLFSNGRVYAPQIFRERDGWVHPVWCAKVIDEVSVFPKGAHDDLCDTMSSALLNLREKGLLLRKDESIVDIESEYIYRPKRQKLYDL